MSYAPGSPKTTHADPRVAELEALAREEEIVLPYPPHYICWLEDRGCVVDLVTGKVYCAIVATPTPSGRAVAHLLLDAVGEVAV
jgi:hypothetical protein